MSHCLYCGGSKRIVSRKAYFHGTDPIGVPINVTIQIWVCERCMHNEVPRKPIQERVRALLIVKDMLALGYKEGKRP